MAASQNPLQGSLFGGNEQSNIIKTQQPKDYQESHENLSVQQLEDDARLKYQNRKDKTSSFWFIWSIISSSLKDLGDQLSYLLQFFSNQPPYLLHYFLIVNSAFTTPPKNI